MAPAEVVPSPQAMVATKALVGSTPLAWVKVAVWKLLRFRARVVVGPETAIASSALLEVLTTVPVTVAVLLAVFGSGLLALTAAVSLKAAPLARLAGAKTTRLKVSALPAATAAVAVSLTLPPDCPK